MKPIIKNLKDRIEIYYKEGHLIIKDEPKWMRISAYGKDIKVRSSSIRKIIIERL